MIGTIGGGIVVLFIEHATAFWLVGRNLEKGTWRTALASSSVVVGSLSIGSLLAFALLMAEPDPLISLWRAALALTIIVLSYVAPLILSIHHTYGVPLKRSASFTASIALSLTVLNAIVLLLL